MDNNPRSASLCGSGDPNEQIALSLLAHAVLLILQRQCLATRVSPIAPRGYAASKQAAMLWSFIGRAMDLTTGSTPVIHPRTRMVSVRQLPQAHQGRQADTNSATMGGQRLAELAIGHRSARLRRNEVSDLFDIADLFRSSCLVGNEGVRSAPSEHICLSSSTHQPRSAKIWLVRMSSALQERF
jgi:hypothetical protein